jgi:nucleoside-triphosphatase
MNHKKNILITGRPRVGKTTLIKHIALLLGDRAGGFYTEEIPGEGVRGRRGFRIITLDGKEGVLAEVGLESRFNVGKYGVNMKDLEEIGVAAINKSLDVKEWIVVDEIGKMEEFSNEFKDVMMRALNSNKRVLTTIRSKDSAFTSDIKLRSDVEIIKLTVPNRQEIFSRLEEMVLGKC